MKDVASYGERPKMSGSFGYRIKHTVVELLKRWFSLQDLPYNCFVILGYGLAVGLAVVQKDRQYIWKLVLLFGMRCIPWFYLIFVQRAVDRIAHPLYMIEFFLLLAMLVKELYDRPLWNVEKYYRMAAAGVLMICVLVSLPFGFQRVKAEQSRRELKLITQQLWDDYAKSNPENYYYLDVYSTVSFMEKMFKEVDNSQKNYDLLGGWVCHSPLQKDARQKYLREISDKGDISLEGDKAGQEVRSISEALLTDNFYFVAEKSCDISFVEEYYASLGKEVSLVLKDTVGEGENPFRVYRIVEN